MYQYTMERKLINEVKKYKCLYSKNSLDYKNKAKRSQAWSKISSAMKINEKICQTKWKYIRDRYVRICNRNAMTGADASESHWLPQKHLHFLKDHISSRSISLTDYQSSDECKNPLSALEQNSQTMYDDDTISEKNMPENDDDDENEDSTSLLDKHFANDAALSSPVVSEARNANCDPEEGLSLKICEMFTKFTDTLRHTQQPAATTSLISKVHEPFLKMLEQHIEKLPEQHQDQLKINILNYAFHYVKGVQNGDDVDEYALE